MLIILLIILFGTLIVNLFEIELPEKIIDILGLVVVVVFIAGILDQYITLTIASIAMYVLGKCIANSIKDFKAFKFGGACLLAIFFIFLNKGPTRFFDEANVLSPIEEYTMNSELLRCNIVVSEAELYIITINTDTEDHEELDQFLKNIRKKSRPYLMVLYYDNDGKFVGATYDDHSKYGVYDDRDDVVEKLTETDLSKCISYIPLVMEGSVKEEGRITFDEDFDTINSPGVHWVNGYDKQNGTHVDGYWRTNPDGDETNNFSYGK